MNLVVGDGSTQDGVWNEGSRCYQEQSSLWGGCQAQEPAVNCRDKVSIDVETWEMLGEPWVIGSPRGVGAWLLQGLGEGTKRKK